MRTPRRRSASWDWCRRQVVGWHQAEEVQNPSHVRISDSTKFQLIINLKTAKARVLTVPPALLARADELIE
jgi:hypothetical protein